MTDAPDSLRAEVAAQLRSELARHQVSGVELAGRLGVSQPYVSRRLSGNVPLDLDDLQRIAGVLGVTVGDLVPAAALSRHWPAP